LRITSCGLTDVGMKRRRNEDSYLVHDDIQLVVVADGMGGHAGGELASQIAVNSIDEVICSTVEESDPSGDPSSWSSFETIMQEKLKYAVRLGGKRIYERAQVEPELHGMGTTAVVLILKANKAFVGHVGDSRCYLIRDGDIHQITEDHSLVNEQIKAGLITPEAAKNFKYKNIITRSLGYQEEVEVDTQVLDVTRGDHFLLCTDGLTGLVHDDEILDMVLKEPFPVAIRRMVTMACERGGDDNITVAVARVDALD
jgi:protein phosphatase